MKNFTVQLLFLSVLFLVSQAKVRSRYADKFKGGLQNKISLIKRDLPPNKLKLGKRQRYKREVIDDKSKERDEFKVEIKFLDKWNPLMSDSESSASRLFRGNVLDAILEQLNGDTRFLNSHVLGLKDSSDGILAQIGFRFRKSELNPISHVKFIVSQGHLSSLKVDKKYFKVLGNNGQIQIPSHNTILAQMAPQTHAQSSDVPQNVFPPQGQSTIPDQNPIQDSSQYIPQTQSQNQPPTRFQKQPPTQSLTYSQDKTQTHTQQQLPTQTNAKSVPRIQIQSLIYPQHNELHPETRNYKKSQSQSKIKAETKPSSAVPHYHSKEKVDAHETSASTVSNNLSIALGNKAQTSSLSPLNKKEENIFIKMNQNWYPFLSNHDSLEYKMLTGNLEKGLKAMTAGDKNIDKIKVKNLIKAEQGLTKVQISVRFLAKYGDPAKTLKAIVNTGDVAGIPVDKNFFDHEMKDDGKSFLSKATASAAKKGNS